MIPIATGFVIMISNPQGLDEIGVKFVLVFEADRKPQQIHRAR